MKSKSDLILISIGRLLQAAVSLVAIRVMTTLLPTQEVGYNYLIMAVAAYFGLIFINPVGVYLNRHIHGFAEAKRMWPFFKVLNAYFLIISLLIIPILFFLQSSAGVLNKIAFLHLAILIALNSFISTWYQTLCPALNMFGKRFHFVFISNLTLILGLLASILGILLINKTAFVWIAGSIAGQCIGAILSYRYLRKFFPENYKSKGIDWSLLFNQQVMKFSLPIALSTLLMWLQTQSYRFVAEEFGGANSVAYLGVGLGVAASLAGLIDSIVTQYFYPSYFAKITNADASTRAEIWNKLFRNSVVIYLLLAACVVAAARPILNVLVDNQYQGLSALVVWGILIELGRILTNLIYTVSHSELKTHLSILPYAIGGCVAFLGSIYVGISWNEKIIDLIPVALFFGSISSLIIMYIKMKCVLNIRLPWGLLMKTMTLCLPLLLGYQLTKDISTIATSIGVGFLVLIYTILIFFILKKNIKEI